MECIVPDCSGQSKYKPDSPYKYAKYCEKHRARMRRHGDPAVALIDHTPATQRWKKRYKVEPKTDCWLWTGTISNGYGIIANGRANQKPAHRFVYEQVIGPIPEGVELDHLCRNRSCVNPKHMGVVTHAVNVQRGDAGIANAIKTHCDSGHEFTPENTYSQTTGGRGCKECRRRHMREYMQKRRAAQREARGPRTHCKNEHDLSVHGYTTHNGTRTMCRLCAAKGTISRRANRRKR